MHSVIEYLLPVDISSTKLEENTSIARERSGKLRKDVARNFHFARAQIAIGASRRGGSPEEQRLRLSHPFPPSILEGGRGTFRRGETRGDSLKKKAHTFVAMHKGTIYGWLSLC